MRTAQQLNLRLHTPKHARRFWQHSLMLLGACWFAVFLVACGGTTITPTPTATSVPATQTIKVFFPHHPESDTDPTAVLALQRTVSTGKDQAFYALQELFKGPTLDERNSGYYSPFDGAMGLISYCSGDFKDFTLSMDHRGTTPEAGTMTVTFCRTIMPQGDLAGFRMESMIKSTLLQFAEIKKVVLLNHDGNCFNDLKGGNDCLNK